MRVMIDVGANDGSESIPWAMGQDVTVYAFEPEPEAFQKLLLSARGVGSYHCINKAVSSSDGMLDFHVSTDPSSSSLLPYSEEGMRRWVCPPGRSHGLKGIIRVEAISLRRFWEEQGLDRVELLKVDTQGHDLEVLKSAGEYLRRISRVVIEVQTTPFELYRGATRLPEALEYMQRFGFTLERSESNTGDQEYNYFFRNTTC